MFSIFGLYLVANLVSNFLFGAYVSVAINCAKIFLNKFRHSPVNWIHLITFILITLLVTIKAILNNVITITAFTNPNEKGVPGYPAYHSVEILTLNVFWNMETIVADAFVIYRVWVVWKRRWAVTIFPFILLAGCFATGVYSMFIRHNPSAIDPADYMRVVSVYTDAFISLTLAHNIICTGLIAFKISHVRSNVMANSVATRLEDNDPIKRVITIIVESAAIYTAHLLLIISLKAAGSPVSRLFIPMVPLTIALVFGSIIVRSVNGVAVGQSAQAGELSTSQGPVYYSATSSHQVGCPIVSSGTPAPGMHVKLDSMPSVVNNDSARFYEVERGSEKYIQ